ncbi:MAG TPA: translocation/assembly module TamB domain-containing protein, partial [Kofleriaceae bacterium]|nr:translocation/assembly module TamB domain-containing protein [Kofleriaceae bacterium]
FSPYGRLPETTPTLDIRTESDYQDISGQQHNILLTLRGPLGQLDWDLQTNTGLNKAQTFTLIFAGRTPDEARALLGDESIGNTGTSTSTAATGTTTGSLVVADQLLKQLAGEYFSLLMEDSIRNVTTLDVARLELGTASVGFHGEKKLAPSVRAIGDLERSLNGWSVDARGQYRLNDSVSLEGGWVKKQYDDDVEEDVDEAKVRLMWRRILLP